MGTGSTVSEIYLRYLSIDLKNDLSDFFNYGHTIETWQFLCNYMKSVRIEMRHSLSVNRYYRGHRILNKEIGKGRFVGTWNYQIWIPLVREQIYNKSIDT